MTGLAWIVLALVFVDEVLARVAAGLVGAALPAPWLSGWLLPALGSGRRRPGQTVTVTTDAWSDTSERSPDTQRVTVTVWRGALPPEGPAS